MAKGISTAVIAIIAMVAIGFVAISLQSFNVNQESVAEHPELQTTQEKVPQETPKEAYIPNQEKPFEFHPKLMNEKVFFEKGNIQFEHYWPNSGSLGSDESEILVYNEGNVSVQIVSTDMKFIAGGKTYTQYSGTWEKFPSRASWDRIEYTNIQPNYYKGEPLIIQPGQKGKIHYHYQFGGDISQQQQAVKINIVYNHGGKEESIDMELKRTNPPLPVTSGQQQEQHQ